MPHISVLLAHKAASENLAAVLGAYETQISGNDCEILPVMSEGSGVLNAADALNGALIAAKGSFILLTHENEMPTPELVNSLSLCASANRLLIGKILTTRIPFLPDTRFSSFELKTLFRALWEKNCEMASRCLNQVFYAAPRWAYIGLKGFNQEFKTFETLKTDLALRFIRTMGLRLFPIPEGAICSGEAGVLPSPEDLELLKLSSDISVTTRVWPHEPPPVRDFYSYEFYKWLDREAKESANVIAPMLIENFSIKSVLDVGCGTGAWLSIFKKCGVEEYFGLDSESVPADLLSIPRSQFRATQLRDTFNLERKFDLAISLDVAMNLSGSEALSHLRDLTAHSDLVLFASAVPGQGGYFHINERPHEYWHGEFAKLGYVHLDFIRPKVSTTSQVSPWYRKNIFLYQKARAPA